MELQTVHRVVPHVLRPEMQPGDAGGGGDQGIRDLDAVRACVSRQIDAGTPSRRRIDRDLAARAEEGFGPLLFARPHAGEDLGPGHGTAVGRSPARLETAQLVDDGGSAAQDVDDDVGVE